MKVFLFGFSIRFNRALQSLLFSPLPHYSEVIFCCHHRFVNTEGVISEDIHLAVKNVYGNVIEIVLPATVFEKLAFTVHLTAQIN